MRDGNRIDFLGFPLFAGTLDNLKKLLIAGREKIIVNTINPHSYVVAKKDIAFADALKTSDYLVPDGSGIVLGVKYRNKLHLSRIAGFDVFSLLMYHADKENLKVFFLGASDSTLEKIESKVSTEYPGASVKCFSPPFKSTFTDEDNLKMLSEVNQFDPDILFVGMTAPKQEKWLSENKASLKFGIASCIGAVFDFYAGNVKRPSPKWQKLGLEWLPRLVSEPRRLWRRTFVSAPLFLWDVFTK